MTNDLKPCPFCGGIAEYRERRVYLDHAWTVECGHCHAKTEMYMVDHPVHTSNGLDESTRYTEEQALAKAADAWNRRASDERYDKQG